MGALYEQAKEGKIIGTVLGVMYDGRVFATAATGECDRNPTFAIAIVQLLSAKLVRLAEAINGER